MDGHAPSTQADRSSFGITMAWIILFLLLLATSLYVAAEFAFVSLPKSRVKLLAESGNPLAKQVLHYVEDPVRLDRFIAACQVGITWSSLVLGAYGQAAFAPGLARFLQASFGMEVAGSISVSIAAILAGLTLVQMILGELVPKSIALHNPLKTALITILPMRWSLVAYSFFIDFLNGSGALLLRAFGASAHAHGHTHSAEEIGLLVSQSGKEGLLGAHGQERLQGALKLATRPVRHLMTPRPMVQGIPEDTDPDRLLDMASRTSYMRLPVFGEETDAIKGIVFARDVLKFSLENSRAPSITEVLRPVLYVPETMTADKLYRFMRDHASHMVLVVDEFGSVIGLVTLDDLAAEMLGDMPDEFKTAPGRSQSLPDDRIRLDGYTRVEDVADMLGQAWEGEAATLGGLVMESLGYLPEPGEKVMLGKAEIEVEKVEGHRVVSLLVKVSPVQEDADA